MKTGDKVRMMDSDDAVDNHEGWPQFYPSPGTVGTVVDVDGETARIQWPKGTTSGSDIWVCPKACLETVDEAVFESGCVIKDSGDRTEFSTGAVRDMHTGKGRMDLLPWNAIIAVSKHCENGALKYGEHNVDKGIPLHSFMDSGMRHAAKVMIGQTDEDHLVAAAWNLLWAIEMRFIHPELCDVPWRDHAKEKED